jgi:hypothetical protein
MNFGIWNKEYGLLVSKMSLMFLVADSCYNDTEVILTAWLIATNGKDITYSNELTCSEGTIVRNHRLLHRFVDLVRAPRIRKGIE